MFREYNYHLGNKKLVVLSLLGCLGLQASKGAIGTSLQWSSWEQQQKICRVFVGLPLKKSTSPSFWCCPSKLRHENSIFLHWLTQPLDATLATVPPEGNAPRYIGQVLGAWSLSHQGVTVACGWCVALWAEMSGPSMQMQIWICFCMLLQHYAWNQKHPYCKDINMKTLAQNVRRKSLWGSHIHDFKNKS